MRLVQGGIANNFGLVGKHIRKYLATTALTATGLMAVATPALADNWTDHVASEGSISIDTATPNTTNIKQNTDFVKVSGDGDINAGWTVNVAQPSNNSKYVLYDIENDPTKIMGNLNANGRVYIFDQNGVIFGEGSQVNVGGIVTSTGHISDANIKAGKHTFENVAGAGEIVNDGSITVSEGGLAAFVAPAVRNNGVINAKAGTVALASGNKVTLDLYGDDLVNIEVDGELENAIVENKGTINASGGTVALTVAAAKNAVDNVVNMDGVIDVSSVSVKGGKIIVNGGKKGTVNVSGKLNASGNGGGTVDVKGQNINVASTSVTEAAGGEGKVDFIAEDHMDFRGSVLAKGADVEVSGYGSLGFSGFVDAKTLLLDPEWAVIHSGVLNNPLGLGYVLSAQALANSMASGTLVTVQADNFIDVGTRNTAYNTGNATVDAILNALIGTGDIDLSTYDYYSWVQTGFWPWQGYFAHNVGTTQSDIKFQSNTVNFNKNLKVGDGDVIVDATNVNLFARLYDKVGALLGDARISSNADYVNVVSNAATIQQGVWLADDAGGATVEVGNGTYTENVSINKGLKLISKNGRGVTTIEGIATPAAEATVQIENGANNVQLGDAGKGFTIVGIDNGNPGIENDAVYLRGNHSNIDIIGNDIVANGDLGLLSLFGGVMSDITIDGNIFSGKTFTGATPATGDQFSVPNVARPLVFFGNAALKSNIVFTNNQITGTAGAGSAGNLLVNIDSTGATITGNTFNGTTGGFQGSLRVRGTNSYIFGNTFYAAGLPSTGYHVYITPSAYAGSLGQDDILDIWNSNTFVGRATVTDSDVLSGYDVIGLTIQGAVDISTATGADIYVNGGATYNESVLVNKSVYLHGANAGKAGYDPTRGPESIVDPSSPGFHVVANDVTIDGFTVTGAGGADGYGVWVDGASNVTVKNNIIHDVTQNAVYSTGTGTEISSNNVYDTGSHGIYVKNGANARILSNEVGLDGGNNNINGDGIKIETSNGSWIKNNTITETTRTADRIGSGIQSVSSNNVEIDENTTYGTEWDGIRIERGTNLSIRENDISDAVRTGIYLGGVARSLIEDNTIADVGRYGVHIDRGDANTIKLNTVDSTGMHGIYNFGARGTLIQQNDIGTLDGAANIGANGIFVEGGTDTVVDANNVQNTKEDGVNATNTVGLKVTGNTISLTGGEGVHVLGSSEKAGVPGSLEVSGNTINNTGSHGIKVENSTNARVLSNLIGTIAAALNIKGDGVHLFKSNGTLVNGNQITNTKSTAHTIGSGVQSIDSNDVVISENTIWNTQWDGVRIAKGTNVLISKNDIDDVTRTGIYMGALRNSTASENTIDDTGRYGIHFDSGNTVKADKNDIDGTGIHGIYSDGALNAVITTNEIGLDGPAFNINGDGVQLYKSNNALVQGNKITNTTSTANDIGSGVQSLESNNLKVLDNEIWNTQWDGVRIAKGDVILVDGNNIDNVKRTGIYAAATKNATISDNDVDTAGHWGIRVNSGDTVVVDNNWVDDTKFDGIYVERAKNITIKNNDVGLLGAGSIDGNGIYSRGNSNVSITDNIVQNAGGDGINAHSTAKPLTITGNDIDDVTGDGIDVNTFESVLIDNNDVRDAGDNGFLVQYGTLANITNNLGLAGTDNGVSFVGKNGIKVGHVDTVNIINNEVKRSGWDGIHVEYFNTAYIADNLVVQSGDDGIEAHDGIQVEITNNDITDSGYGILSPGEGGVDYDGFDEFYKGHDGIHVHRISAPSYSYDKVSAFVVDSGTGYVRVTDNTINLSADDGVDIDGVNGYVYVAGNTITDSGVTDDNTTIINDGVDYNGADGISIRNVGQPYSLYGVVREGDAGNGEYNIVVFDNDVTNSLDDGIEIIGSGGYISIPSFASKVYDDYYFYGTTGRVLVQQNSILNSGWGAEGFGDYQGGDGIHVSNVNPGYYGYDYLIGESEGGYYGYAVDILGNDVTNSGDDGIEVAESHSTLIDANIVKNSGTFSPESGDGEGSESEVVLLEVGDTTGSDGIHVRNVGYYYEDRGEVFPIEEGDFSTAFALPGYGYQPYAVVIRNNDVDNSADNGIQVDNMMEMPVAPVLIENNLNVSNSGNQALYISGFGHGDVIVRGNGFSNFDTGGQFESGLIDLSQEGNSWTNGNIGLRFSPYNFGGEVPSFANLNLVDVDGPGSTPFPETPVNFGGTIGSQTFSGFTEDGKFYVYLDQGAFTNEGTPIWINGLNSSYDGLQPSLTGGLLTEEQFAYLDARFHHFPQDATTDIFWFGFTPDLPLIEQSLIFNRFGVFNGDTSGLNIQILSLPSLGGGQPFNPAQLNNIVPFAGGTNPSDLNNIETAAGGEEQPTGQQLNNIETASGGENETCWSNAVAAAGAGQVVNVVYTGGFSANLNQAAACGTGF